MAVPGCDAITLAATSNAYVAMKVVKESYQPGEEMVFACKKGFYKASGNERRKCTADLIWDGKDLKCSGKPNLEMVLMS